MNNKIIKTFILVTLLALLVGLASATDVSTDTTNTPAATDVSVDAVSTDTTPSTVEDTTPTRTGTVQESVTSNQIENKIITKEEKNKKTENEPINVGDYDNLTRAFMMSGDVIVNITANITLTDSPYLSNSKNTLTIEGNGFIINGNGHQFLYIDSETTTVNIKNLTITNCYSETVGGAIYNEYGCTLTITDSNLTNNKATGQRYGYGGAIYNNGTLNINNTNLNNNTATGQLYHGYGGAIYNYNTGTLNITNSNLTNNKATGQRYYGFGGAIYNNGTLNITNSNLTDNTATGQNIGFGGAIYNYNGGTLNITDSNLNNNTATGQYSGRGGAIHNNGTLNINNTNLNNNTATGQTYDGYGGAIHNNGTLNITNSNLNNNTATGQRYGYGGAIYNDGGTNTISNTIFYNNTPANFIINQENQIELITDDNYISVGDFTIMVDDTVNGTGSGTDDFDNIIVPMGDNIKLIFNGTNMTNNTYILRSNTRNVTDYPALIAAIEEAKQNNYNKFIINLQPGGNYNATDNIRYEDSLTKDITINGNGQTLNGLNTYQFIHIAGGHDLTLTNITITNYTAERGGAINNSGTLTIISCDLTHNTAIYYNGGAINNLGTLTLISSNLKNNTATTYGGAIYNEERSTVNIINSNITHNNITGRYGYGGAIHNKGTLTITGSNITYNNITGEYGYGGAIYSNGNLSIMSSNLNYNNAQNGGAMRTENSNNMGKTVITASNFTHNTAMNGGGAMYISGHSYNHDPITITASNINNNTAGWGGAILIEQDALNLSCSNITDNIATGQDGCGGAIYLVGGTINITDSNITHNNAPEKGGAVYNTNGIFKITNSNLNYNNATSGGAAFISLVDSILTNVTITDSNLNYNTATNGGAIFIMGFNNFGSNFTITNSNFTYNNATEKGGAIYNNYNNLLTITGSNLKNNNANYGGAILNKGTYKITNTTFYNNNPANFIINTDNHIQLENTDYFISITEFTIIADGVKVHRGTSQSDFGDYTISPDSLNVQLILNGTNTTNNIFILRKSKKVNITNYQQLIDAVEDAKKTDYDDYTINLEPGEYIATANITWTDSATPKIIINGNGNTLNGQNMYQFINITGGYDLTLKNITLTNYTAKLGGAIYNNGGTLSIIDSNLTHNNASGEYGRGGAIYNFKATLNITGSNLTHNTAPGPMFGHGGAIYSFMTPITITDSNLNNNTAYIGGAIYNDAMYNEGIITITNSNFTYNTATGEYGGDGGAIHDTYNNITITESNLSYNTATGQYASGGAISSSGNITITKSNLSYNKATGENGHGGAIRNNGGNIIITDSNLNYNTATDDGGAIDTYGRVNITGSNLTYNTANGDGGAIDNGGKLIIIGSNINYNIANNAGGFGGGAIRNNGKLNITDSNFTHNTAMQNGGAIYTYDSINITGSNFTHNTANKDGGAICNDWGAAEIYMNTFTNNLAKSPTSTENKGAIIDEGRDTIIANNTNANLSKYSSTIYTNNYFYYEDIEYDEVFEEKYPVNITFNTFVDEPRNTTITISTNNTTTPTVTDTINITLELKDEFNLPVTGENITVNINQNKTTLKTDSSGIASIEYQVIGTETFINATYSGKEGDYNANNTTLTLLAEKMKTKLLVDDVSVAVGKEFTINGILLDINDKAVVGALVNITVNGTKTNATTNAEGQFNTTITLHEMGEYPINVVFYENSGYKESNNNTAKVTASKTDTHITLKVSNNTPVNDTVITITVNLTDDTGEPLDNQEVNVTIGEETFTINTTNGIASRLYTVSQVGAQTITATYTGNNMYNANSTTTQINVIKLDTKLTLNVSDNTPVNNTQVTITATLTDTANNKLECKNITLNINGKNQTITTNNNGTATQTYTPTKTGKQTITATYNGDSQYNNSTKQSTQINVIKIDTKLTLNVSNNTPINSTTINITATLTDTKGNKLANQNISLTVGGKTYTVKTNANGTAIQNYTPTKVEKQIITATYKGDSKYTGSTATTNITVKKINTKITLNISNTTPVNNTPITITATLTDTSNNKLANQNITLNINGKTVTTKTNSNGTVTRTYTPTNTGKQNITAAYNGDSKYTNTTKTSKITVRNKYSTKTVTTAVTGTIGEKLTLTATVTDENNQKVNDGNLIFKINGVTIKDNGKLTGSSNPLKVKVTNGIATTMIIPDWNMVNSDKITASYIGTTIYNASTSTPASIKISKRNATIEISTNKKIVKQGQVLTITAKIYDTTGGKKSTNLAAYSDEFVYFKINGVTVKDEKGEMLKVKVVNGVARLNYTVPLGISCVLDTQSMTPKNHTIQVGFYNKNYQDIITNNPQFQVERSNITINLANATINNKTHTLSMKITIKDYLGNVVAGPNKCIIKVNGVTLKNNTQVAYFYTTDGVLNLKNALVPIAKNYATIEVVTQDRLAYKSQRNTTKVIKITN